MDRLEELHGRWEASNAPAQKMRCPTWAEDINCFSMHESMQEQQQRMQEEYEQMYKPHACELHAWDANGFDRCVANRRIILIGDSLMRQMFQSLACLLGPVTASEHASNWSDTSSTSAVNYPMPGYPGKYVSKQFWGELQLVSGASVHARIFGSFSSILLEDLLTELGPLTERDVIITNFGAWYPRFVKQDGGVVVSSTYQRFERDMADLMRVLRQTPAQVLWRSYAPTHFGGESGAYVSGEDYQEGCKPAALGEVWYDKWVADYLSSCGAKCDRVHMLPVFQLSLNKHQSHLGSISKATVGSQSDCRHWCSNVLHAWNQVLYNKLCF
ncbi:g6638 [Coccomyxa elongata]